MKLQAITEDDNFEIIDLTQPSHRPIAPLPFKRKAERQGSILDHPRIIAFSTTTEKLTVPKEAPSEVPQKPFLPATFPLTEEDLAFVNEVDDELFKDLEKTRTKEKIRKEKRRKRDDGRRNTLDKISEGVVEIVEFIDVDVDEVIDMVDEDEMTDILEDDMINVNEDILMLDDHNMINEEPDQTQTVSPHPPSRITSPSMSSPLSSFAGIFDDDPEPFLDFNDDRQDPALVMQLVPTMKPSPAEPLNNQREPSPTETLIDGRVSPPSETLEDERVNGPPTLQENQPQSAQNEPGIRNQRGDSIQDQNDGISWSSASNAHITEVTAQPNEEAMTFSVKKELLEVLDRSNSMGTGLDDSDLIDAAENGQSMDIQPRIQDQSTNSTLSEMPSEVLSEKTSNGVSSADQPTLSIDSPGPSDPAPSLSEEIASFDERLNHLQTQTQWSENPINTHINMLETPIKEVTTSSSCASPSKAFTQFTPSSNGTPSPTPENSLEAIDTQLSPSRRSPSSRLNETAPDPKTVNSMLTTPSSRSVDSPDQNQISGKPIDDLEKGRQGTLEMQVPRVTGNYLPTPSPSPIRPHSELPSTSELNFTGHSIPGHTAWFVGKFH